LSSEQGTSVRASAHLRKPPAMTFDAADLLDERRMREGPVVVFWNQNEWIEPRRPMPLGGPLPKRSPIQRARRLKPWHIEMRLQPPPGEDLQEWGQRIAQCLGVPWGEPREGDRAVWLPGSTWARNAGGAIGSAGVVFKQLADFQLAAAQIRVTRARPERGRTT
jgi:hypothetical protein